MSVTHYADTRIGVTFINEHTLAPIPGLCGDGNFEDLMTFDVDQVTCPACLAEMARAS